MKKLLLVACMAFAAVLLSSCGSTKVEEVAAPNYEGAWVVEEFVKDGAVVTGATANIEISAPVDGVYKVIGNTGLNQLLPGDFTITADTIAPVNAAGIGMTKMAGKPEVMAYEQAFLDVILGTNKIALEGEKLVISNETAKITFVAGTPAAMPIDGEEAPAEIEE